MNIDEITEAIEMVEEWIKSDEEFTDECEHNNGMFHELTAETTKMNKLIIEVLEHEFSRVGGCNFCYKNKNIYRWECTPLDDEDIPIFPQKKTQIIGFSYCPLCGRDMTAYREMESCDE